MKAKSIFLSLAALAMMAACSNDELVEKTDNNGVDGKETEWHANVQLILPSVAGAKTRANGEKELSEPTFDDGTEAEYNIIKEECYFEAFDDGGHRIGAASGAEINWTKDENNENSVTLNGTIIIRSSLKPASVVCFLNLKKDLMSTIKGMKLADLKSAQTLAGLEGTKEAMTSTFARVSSDKGGFFMTNSSYFDSNTNLVQEVSVKDAVYEQGKDAKDPVTIHVERVVAKATADIKLNENAGTEAKKLNDGSTFYTLKCTVNTGDGTKDVEFGVKFLAWGLNATNRSFLPLKNIGKTNDWDFGTHAANSPSLGRSYWAIDGNYNDGNYLGNLSFEGTHVLNSNLDLNYYKLSETTNRLGEDVAEYCFENTMDGSLKPKYGCVTHVLFKAQYTDSEGNVTDENIYRLGKGIYTEQSLKEYVIALLKDRVTSKDVELSVDDITLTRNEGNYKDRADVKAIIKCTNSDISFQDGVNKDDLGKTIFADRDCWVYPEGLCYYTIPIKHFADLKDNERTGYFGVVRNHWYQVNVTDILEFGHPADPDKPIVPEDIEDNEWLLNCNIKVLAWGKVDVDASVGDNSGWQ